MQEQAPSTNEQRNEFTLAEARLSSPPHAILLEHYSEPGLRRESARFFEFIEVDIAHTVMLARQSIIKTSSAGALLRALVDLQDRGVDALPIDPARGSLLLQVERYLASHLGENVAGQLHTGRSRIDQGATVRRLFERRYTLEVFKALLNFRQSLLRLASRHFTTVMPGYTHMQQAQPWVFGHYLLSFSARTHDDFDRLRQAYRRMNLNPLGSVGLSGTSWHLDRSLTADFLGFEGLVENAKLAREAYYAADVTASLSFIMADLNDLATDLHIWSMTEIGIVECDDAFCGTSSIFPQKKNPVGLETIKKAAGPASTWLATALATFRAEGTGDQSVRELALLEDAAKTTAAMLGLMSAIVDTLIVNTDRMHSLVTESWVTSSNLADAIVRHSGHSFREVHHVVGRLIRNCLAAGIPPSSVTPEMIDAAANEITGATLDLPQELITEALDPRAFIESRATTGSVNPKEIKRMSDRERERLDADANWYESETSRIGKCHAKLHREAHALVKGGDVQ